LIDEFAIGLNLIAKMLEKDWITLYYVLPFYPERGNF
jgi:hypothetical protein